MPAHKELFTVVVEKEKLAKLLPRSIILFSYLRFPVVVRRSFLGGFEGSEAYDVVIGYHT